MKRIAVAVCLCVAMISGCETSGPFTKGERVNYAASVPVGAQLTGGEQAELARAFRRAMETSETGAPQKWSMGGVRGEITPGPRQAGNLRSDATSLLTFTPGLFLSQTYETELGEYVLVRNSNIRYGPSTDYDVIEQMQSGDGVEVVGRVIDKPWMLIAVDGNIRGFIYQDLVVKRPGSELELAGGPTKRPYLCRKFEQRLTKFGQSDRWSGVACNMGNGWELVEKPADPYAPTTLY